MLLVTNFLRWWYSAGLRQRKGLLANQLESTIDFFSINILISTLFSPFRQISAGRVDGPLDVQLRAVLDKIFSRLIGAVIRTGYLMTGLIVIIAQFIFGLLIMLGWIFVPLSPVIGVLLVFSGMVP